MPRRSAPPKKSGSERIRQTFPALLFLFVASIALRLAAGQTGNLRDTAPLPTLVRAGQVRNLTPEKAALGYPVRVRGVVTDDVPEPDFFVQDASAGIYVEGLKAGAPRPRLGDLVEVDGTTGPGKFAPVIVERRVMVLGKASLPTSRIYSFSEISDGRLDSQWIRLRGIVRSVSIDRASWAETTLAMRVASGGGELNVRVPIQQEKDFSSWIDREVLLEGVCGSLFNIHRQLTAVLLYVPKLSFITVEAPAHEVPFSSLLTFSPGETSEHRVRVRGVVGYQEPGKAVFIQREGRGLRILTAQDTKLKPGDVIDVLGFPATGESAPVLEDAVFHRVGTQPPPSPVPLDLDLPWEIYDGNLITVDATLLSRNKQAEGVRLVFQHEQSLFDATLSPQNAESGIEKVPLNSTVRVTGICLVQSGGLWSIPQSFRVLLRSPDDLLVLRAPSWWTLRHTVWLLGIVVGAFLVVLAWMVVLGRRLREQMELIRQKLQSGAVLQERNRIARELHDNLEQELAGITMQLDLAADCFERAPKIAQHALHTARNMSRHSMVDARRSVWDLRCHLLEQFDLVAALQQAVQPAPKRDDVSVKVSVHGKPIRLDAPIEMNLLRIGQEAVANAVKHGHAKVVEADLYYEEHQVRLCVTDDGRGFRPDDGPPSGHFGMLDMRERAQAMGSVLQVESQPELGTRVAVAIPVSGQKTS